jgi:hypothetical protein
MERIDLLTAAPWSEFVATVEVPAFAPGLKADVILWGNRFFKRHAEQSRFHTNHAAYVEVFGVVAIREATNGNTETGDTQTQS